ncbi:MAG: hypothetical protein ACLTUW_11035 [Lachnospira eligens]
MIHVRPQITFVSPWKYASCIVQCHHHYNGDTKAARYVKLELRIDFFDEFMASLP